MFLVVHTKALDRFCVAFKCHSLWRTISPCYSFLSNFVMPLTPTNCDLTWLINMYFQKATTSCFIIALEYNIGYSMKQISFHKELSLQIRLHVRQTREHRQISADGSLVHELIK